MQNDKRQSEVSGGWLFFAFVGDEEELRAAGGGELGGAFFAAEVVADAQSVALEFEDGGEEFALVGALAADDVDRWRGGFEVDF
jgi:hypothetical protein